MSKEYRVAIQVNLDFNDPTIGNVHGDFDPLKNYFYATFPSEELYKLYVEQWLSQIKYEKDKNKHLEYELNSLKDAIKRTGLKL